MQRVPSGLESILIAFWSAFLVHSLEASGASWSQGKHRLKTFCQCTLALSVLQSRVLQRGCARLCSVEVIFCNEAAVPIELKREDCQCF
jgi:hypothetical protein